MLDDFGQRIRDIILSEMDLSRELSDEEICDLIGSVVSREARDRPMTIKDRAELERTIFNSLRKLDVLQELVRMTGAHESFRMDNAICELSTDVSYKYHGIFLCFVNLLDGADNEYTIKNKAKYSYYGR